MRAAQIRDCLENALARSERQADLFEIGLRQLRQNISLDFALAKRVLVLAKPKTAQPSADIHIRPNRLGEMMVPADPTVQGIAVTDRFGSI
jgi:hypothetical protein